jgi:hypothetical protein
MEEWKSGESGKDGRMEDWKGRESEDDGRSSVAREEMVELPKIR